MSLHPGQVVEFQGKEHPIQLGVVLAVTPKGVRLLQLNRKETTVTERTILHTTAQAKASPADLDACWETARRIDEKRGRLATGIDLGELHALLGDDPRGYSLAEMAGFLADSGDEDAEAALLRRLTTDAFYFRQRKEGFVPVPAAEVKTALEREQKRTAQEAEDEALYQELKAAAAAGPVGPFPRVAAVLEALVQVLLMEAEAPVPKRLHEVLERAGLHQPRPLFGFLVRMGRLAPDENLDLLRNKVPVAFSDSLLAEAERLAGSPPSLDGRRDLRTLSTWAIDSETTRDRDDAFSIEANDHGITLWIHVSDVAAWIPPGSPLDAEACRRGTTLYMPEGNIPMLPPEISEGALSLTAAGDRPALTWEIGLSGDGSVTSHDLYRSVIRVTHPTDYAAADGRLEAEPELAAAVRLGGLLRERRRQAGALLIERQPELKLTLGPEGVKLGYRPANSPTSDTIMEFMVLANHLAARRCQEKGLPCLYRSQEPPETKPDLPVTFQPVAFFQALRSFRKTVLGPNPGPHASLGVNPYCQVTSPLRRYSDLLIQRQLAADLEGLPPPYDREGFQQALQRSDEATRLAESLMRNRQDYWLLTFLRQEMAAGRDSFPGVVVDLSPTDVYVYFELTCEFRHCRRPSADLAVGQRVSIRVKKADPFEGMFRFEVVP
ncbi:MAG: RNB domain-containing ribonuclease [Candidatus Riflebacteria bacterium]|nr:RNB domain-containing ribonuclease [Candidatus Riflebacteria bacterium]